MKPLQLNIKRMTTNGCKKGKHIPGEGLLQLGWLLGCLILLNACNKQLDFTADGRLPDVADAFTDYNRVRGYLNSCYGYCPSPSMNRASFTDEAQDADDITSGSDFINWYRGALTASTYAGNSADGSPWTTLFQGIHQCNTFLKYIKTATIYAREGEQEGWIAQAHTLRALYYLQLIKRYGGVPIFKEPLGIKHDFSQDRRAKFGEVVQFILADCDSALTAPDSQFGFPWNIYDNQFGIMTRSIPYAIKSQAITYAMSPLWNDGTFTLEEAAKITAEALFQCTANDYKLFDVTPAATIAQNAYAYYFITSSNDKRTVDKETIFQQGNQLAVWRDAGMPTTAGMSKAGPCPTQDLVDAYEMANGEPPILGYSDADHLVPIVNPASGYDPNNPYVGRDPRFYASIYYNGAVRFLNQPNGRKVASYIGGADSLSEADRRYTRTSYYQRKFNNSVSSQSSNADGAIRLLRLAELYLNFAEMAYQAAGPDVPVTVNETSMSARQAVNAVRKRAGMPDFPAGMSKEAFEKKYRNERRIELAFEEHRFFDVRRWKILDQTDKFVTGMRIRTNGSGLTYTRFRFNDRGSVTDRFLMYPIDKNEVDKIIGLSGVNWQNPGW
ncbi:RagB/SusD family nutrient uptake outer membrane protein [Niabella sp. CC-SYL272]|uniref:RagB/SusD family nutrient uptake outer membrane protein n=1 Tax=Niabella agricola TaxID=2891571 RepID=UPI001F3C5D77|nr:RagB/SusD family nutrient uptake outer membrane protein [Niabella agricola]MCF3110037.1 RagB/SusD family nutrient uptake outer membrane protein [Niabella agricola]